MEDGVRKTHKVHWYVDGLGKTLCGRYVFANQVASMVRATCKSCDKKDK